MPALSGIALPVREMRDVVEFDKLKLTINGSGAPPVVWPRMYPVVPVDERKNCVGVKVPSPRFMLGPGVAVTVSDPRGEGQPDPVRVVSMV